jgi:hypothetical protein
MSPLSREAIFTVLSGLTVLACDKTTASPEPVTSASSAPVGLPAVPAVPAAPVAAAKEVPAAQGSAAKPAGSATATEKEKSCAPGGCAPGQCGANK